MFPKRVLITFLLVCTVSFGQSFSISDIFKNQDFHNKSLHNVRWSNNGKVIWTIVDDVVAKLDLEDELSSGVITESGVEDKKIKYFDVSDDNRYFLLTTYLMPRYDKPGGDIVIYDDKRADFTVIKQEEGSKQWVPGFVGNDKIAFVRDDNLYLFDLNSKTEKQLTSDGNGTIINGHFDWVYQEELDGVKGWEVSPDGKTIAFFQFDQSPLPKISIAKWDSLYFNSLDFHYPKPGADNSTVRIGLINIESGKTMWVPVEGEDYYLPRIKFTNDPELLSFQKLNRLQNRNELWFVNINTLEKRLVLAETSDAWVDVHSNLKFVGEDKFLWSSERSGFNHLYMYDYDGNEEVHYDIGESELFDLLAVDEENEKVYFTSNQSGVFNKDLYSADFDGSDIIRLSKEEGTHEIEICDNPKYYFDKFSSATKLWSTKLYKVDGEFLKQAIPEKDPAKQFNFSTPQFISFNTSDGVEINGMLIKPNNYEEGKKYPLIVYNYSGPGSNVVENSWGGVLNTWGYYMAQKGYMVAMFDNRGTGRRGTEFKHVVYKQLGTYEVNDIAEGVNYLVDEGLADRDRVAIIGWSYGGFVSLSAICRKPDLFKVAVSIAPVTDYRFYDNVYTERFMQTPALNKEGYDNTAPQHYIQNLKGDILLVHGTADDNVHLQNSIDFIKEAIKADKQIRTFFYPERNHSIYGDNARPHLFKMFTDFIVEKL